MYFEHVSKNVFFFRLFRKEKASLQCSILPVKQHLGTYGPKFSYFQAIDISVSSMKIGHHYVTNESCLQITFVQGKKLLKVKYYLGTYLQLNLDYYLLIF